MSEQMNKIKEINIIKKFKSKKKYYEKFCNLVNQYSNELDSGAIEKEIGFTPHDFSHHCVDIYTILSNLIDNNNKFSAEEMFLLLTSVLFHDVGMSIASNEESRLKHSEIGKQRILNDLSGEEFFVKNCDQGFIDLLGDIIYAHSDLKLETGEIYKYTFEEIICKYEKRSFPVIGTSPINVIYIAALLRFADELDISYKRVADTGYKHKKNSDESKMHYQVCDCLNEVRIDGNLLVINIIDYNFNKLTEKDKIVMAGEIINKYKKVKKEFDFLYKNVFSNNKYVEKGIWKVDNVILQEEEMLYKLCKKKGI